MEEGRGPIKRFYGYGGGVTISAWRSDKGVNYTLQKRYKDKTTGEWKETKTLFPSDLVALSHLAVDAVRFGDEFARNNRSAGQSDAPAQSIDVPDVEFPEFGDDDIPF